MAALNIKMQPLKLATINGAERHNMRLIQAEMGADGRIDPLRSPLNFELIDCPAGLRVTIIQTIVANGIDLTERKNRRKDKGLAVECLFSLAGVFEGDLRALFADCIEWLKHDVDLSGCPIVHAIVHMDEANPHMHVILLPIMDGNLQASKVIGYKSAWTARMKSLHEQVSTKHGLQHSQRLRGAAKQKASDKVINAIKRNHSSLTASKFWLAIRDAIVDSPDSFLAALGGESQPISTNRSFVQIMTSTGRKTAEDKQVKKATASCVVVAATPLSSCGLKH